MRRISPLRAWNSSTTLARNANQKSVLKNIFPTAKGFLFLSNSRNNRRKRLCERNVEVRFQPLI